MGDVVGWVWITFVMITSLVLSAVMRRGRSAKARKAFLDLYRRQSLPALFRNAWMAMPLLVAGFVTLWVGIGIAPGLAESGVVQDSLAFPLAFGAIGLAMALFGGFVVLASRPPRWLVPAWVPKDDGEAGYVPPKPDWFDRIVTAVGLLFFVVGAVVDIAVLLGFAHR